MTFEKESGRERMTDISIGEGIVYTRESSTVISIVDVPSSMRLTRALSNGDKIINEFFLAIKSESPTVICISPLSTNMRVGWNIALALEIVSFFSALSTIVLLICFMITSFVFL